MFNKLKKIICTSELRNKIETLEKLETLETPHNPYSHNQRKHLREHIQSHIIENTYAMSDKNTLIGGNVLTDIELFKTYQGEYDNTVFDKLNHCKLQGSSVYLTSLLQYPIYDVTVLRNRQDFLKVLEGKFELVNDTLFESVQCLEEDLLWIYGGTQEEVELLFDIVYFKMILLRCLNKNETVLTFHNTYKIIFSPLIGILSPIVYFIIPFLIFKMKFKTFNLSFVSYIKTMFHFMFSSNDMSTMVLGPKMNRVRYLSYAFSLIFYFQSLFNSLELSKATFKISKLITNKMNNIINIIKTANEVNNIFWDDRIQTLFFNDPHLKLEEIDSFNHIKPQQFTLLSNYGKQLKFFKFFKKDHYIPLLKRFYMIDALLSIIRMKHKSNLCYTTFLHETNTVLLVKDVVHPCLESNKAIANDLELGGNNEPMNVILTGPNAGGKSTFIKSLIINVILSQSICVTYASECRLTPIVYINSQINVPDCKGKESLFEAEMYRCKEVLDNLKQLQNKPSMVFMDEIFNSTNPIEGIAGAYAILKKMAEHPNNLSIVSTHFVYLAKLSKIYNTQFKALKMNVRMKSDMSFEYPYKISRGVSKQYIALELLKLNGFDASILDDALAIKADLLKPILKPKL